MSFTKVAHVMRRFTMDKWGGTESVVYHVCQRLQQRGVDTKIFCTDMFSKPGTELIDSVAVRRFSYVFPWLFLSKEAKRKLQLKGGSPLSIPLFFSLLCEPNVSIIHTHVQHRLGGIARTVARIRGIPYVASIHGGYYSLSEQHAEKMRAPFAHHLEWGKAFGWLFCARRTLEDADAIICVGKDEYKKVCAKHPKQRVEYIPNGVDIARFRQANAALFRKKWAISEKEKLVLCISRIDYQKNQELLVRAFARFSKDQPGYRLVLIGPVNVEEYYDQLIQKIALLGIEKKVLVIPGLSPEDPALASAYHAADMFVLPSRIEPFGIVILEAWAAKTPVIASCVGGIPGFTSDGENVLLFKDNDEDKLLAKMQLLAESCILQESLKRGGEKEVEKYSWDSVVSRLFALYRDLIDAKQKK